MADSATSEIKLSPLLVQKIVDLAGGMMVASIDATGMPRMTPSEAATLATCVVAQCYTNAVAVNFDFVANGVRYVDDVTKEDLAAIKKRIEDAQKKEADLLATTLHR